MWGRRSPRTCDARPHQSHALPPRPRHPPAGRAGPVQGLGRAVGAAGPHDHRHLRGKRVAARHAGHAHAVSAAWGSCRFLECGTGAAARAMHALLQGVLQGAACRSGFGTCRIRPDPAALFHAHTTLHIPNFMSSPTRAALFCDERCDWYALCSVYWEAGRHRRCQALRLVHSLQQVGMPGSTSTQAQHCRSQRNERDRNAEPIASAASPPPITARAGACAGASGASLPTDHGTRLHLAVYALYR